MICKMEVCRMSTVSSIQFTPDISASHAVLNGRQGIQRPCWPYGHGMTIAMPQEDYTSGLGLVNQADELP